MGSGWGPEGPPSEAYGRVTNPERFAPVVAAADALVERLLAAYDVVVEGVDMPHTTRAVRLQPAAGAQVTIGVTEFPGAHYAMGNWCHGAAPRCGCDACDETADEAVEDLVTTIENVVVGNFAERLTSRPSRLWSQFGASWGWTRVEPEAFRRLAELAPPGTYEWPAWPQRQPVLRDTTA